MRVPERGSSRLDSGDLLLIGGAVLALVSLFLPWLDVGLGITRNGWQESGWLWVAVGFGYPVAMLVRGQRPHRGVSLLLVGVALLAGLGIWSGNQDAFRFGDSMFHWRRDANGAGVYVYLVATALAVAGAFMAWWREREAATAEAGSG